VVKEYASEARLDTIPIILAIAKGLLCLTFAID